MNKILKGNNKDCNKVNYHLLDYIVINYKYYVKRKTISSKEFGADKYISRTYTYGRAIIFIALIIIYTRLYFYP